MSDLIVYDDRSKDLTYFHQLKTLPNTFEAVKNGTKNFELRKNDRNFHVGDTVSLVLFEPDRDTFAYNQQFNHLEFRIVGILRNCPGLDPGYVILQLGPLTEKED